MSEPTRPDGGRPWPRRLLDSLRGIQAKTALAIAGALVLVAIANVLVKHEPVPRPIRGASPARPLALEPRATARGTELAWTAARDAEAYRVTFSSAQRVEIARLEGVRKPRLELRAEALPAGLEHGQEVLVEVVALRAGNVIARSEPLPLRVP